MSLWPAAKPPRPKTARKTRAPRTVRTHVFLNGGQQNHAGVGICEGCGNLRTNPVHDLTVSVEAVELDRRRIGEGTEQ